MLFNQNRQKQLDNLQAAIEEISGDLELHENTCKECADNTPCERAWSLIQERRIYVCLRKFFSGGAK